MPDLAPIPVAEIRALTMHDVVPAGHTAIPVTRDDWAPHLRAGEFAIIDLSDTEPQLGELYVLAVGTTGRTSIKIVQPYRSGLFSGCDGVMFQFSESRPGRFPYVDGPLRRDAWTRKCRGRVVGVLSSPFSQVTYG